MPLIRAYALPHPPLAVPQVGRGQDAKIKDTIDAFNQVAKEIASLAPETILVITPHGTVYSDYLHISPGEEARGDFSTFGVDGLEIEAQYDTELAREISNCASEIGLAAGEMGERNPSLDHGVLVPLWFIKQFYSDFKLLRLAQSGLEPSAHYSLGKAIIAAADKIGRRVVLIASADLSHKLSEEGPYGFAEEGVQYDERALEALATGNFIGLFNISESLREKAAECGHNSYMVLAGAFDGRQVDSKLLSYEGPFGVGYAVATFQPKEPARDRNFLEQFEALSLAECEKLRLNEDPYQALARLSLEYTLKEGRSLPLTKTSLPQEMLDRKAGVFVSINKFGRLRGCIGTISPTTGSIAEEIIQIAVSAGLHDSRFDQVKLEETPYLSYKVDVLAEPEAIPDSSYLDVKRYGLIVMYGTKRALLLPNLEGVDSVEQQLSIARQKAGIPENIDISDIKLERFEVIRHG